MFIFCLFQFLKKLNRQERVVEEVKHAIKPHYAAGKIDKADYKEIRVNYGFRMHGLKLCTFQKVFSVFPQQVSVPEWKCES